MNRRLSVFAGALGAVLAAGTGSAQALPDGAGKDVTEKTCTACHAATQFTSQHQTQAQWTETVNQMISMGAQVSDEDYPVIVDYLAKHFGAAAAPGAPAAPPPAAANKSR